jgi:hypothetical protein
MEPLPASFQDRYRYIVTFVDDFSRYLFAGLMRRQNDLGAAHVTFRRKSIKLSKSRVVTVLVDEENNQVYQAALPGELVQVCRVHSDGAKEDVALREELDDATAHTLSPAYTPGLHSIAERVHRTVTDAARTVLIDASLSSTFWPHAVKHTVTARNRVPCHATRGTPSYLLTGVRPTVKYVRVFGSTAYVLQPPAGVKRQPRTEQGVFLERLDHGVYHVLLVGGDGASPRIVESQHCTFDETSWAPKALLMRMA